MHYTKQQTSEYTVKGTKMRCNYISGMQTTE